MVPSSASILPAKRTCPRSTAARRRWKCATRAACRRAGRNPADVTLIAVTKGQGVDAVRENVLAHGHAVLGESRIQEWRDKAAELGGVQWHLIGNLQTNKVKYCRAFHTLHSLNSARLADAILSAST